MKRILLLLLASILIATSPALANPQSRAASLLALQSSVVLVGEIGRGFCGGTIAGADMVVTAFHCVRFFDDKPVMVRQYVDPTGVLKAKVAWTRPGADLAVLKTDAKLAGRVAPLVTDVAVGDAIILVGAPQTLTTDGSFMVTRGWVGMITSGAFLGCDGKKSTKWPFGYENHQIIFGDVHAYYGNSGGGAFNDRGEFMGVLVRGETAEPDSYRECSDDFKYNGEDLLWVYIVGPVEIAQIPR